MVSLSSHTGVTPGSLRTTAFAWKRRRATLIACCSSMYLASE